MKSAFWAAGLGLLLAGCAPKVITQLAGPAASAEQAAAPAPAADPTAFLVIKDTEPFEGPAEELGDIQIKDSGLTLNCDYETVVAVATTQAQKLGANVLRIYEHRLPDALHSTCHRIRAKALRVPDTTPYEKELVWNPGRHLRTADFKANTANRPFAAATNSGIRYHYAGRPFQRTAQLTIETVFDCENSYFKASADATRTLAHEQGHFDITEIFARRFAKALQEQVTDLRDLERRQQALFQQITSAAHTMQDEYDTDVYADPNKQAAWLARIAQELAGLQAYASKQVTVKL